MSQQIEPGSATHAAQQRQRASQLAQAVRNELQKAVIGQNSVIDDVLTALIAGGHVLLEGVPGLGKTLLNPTYEQAEVNQFVPAFINVTVPESISAAPSAIPPGFLAMETAPKVTEMTTITGPILPIMSTMLPSPMITVPPASSIIKIAPAASGKPKCWLRVAPAPAIMTTYDMKRNAMVK